jgi:DNA-binding HxlR family transcriptional regulator
MEITLQDRALVLDTLNAVGETLDFIVHTSNVPAERIRLALKELIRDGLVVRDIAFPDQYSSENPKSRYILTVMGRDARLLLRHPTH